MRKIFSQIEEEKKQRDIGLGVSFTADENNRNCICIVTCPLDCESWEVGIKEIYRVFKTKDNIQDLQRRLSEVEKKYNLPVIWDDTDPLKTMRPIIQSMLGTGPLGLAIGFDIDEDGWDYLYIEAVSLDEEVQKDEEIFVISRKEADVSEAKRWIRILSKEFHIPVLWDHTQELTECKQAM